MLDHNINFKRKQCSVCGLSLAFLERWPHTSCALKTELKLSELINKEKPKLSEPINKEKPKLTGYRKLDLSGETMSNLCEEVLHYVVEVGSWELKHAKPGDVGYDLPVVINSDNPLYQSRVNYNSDTNYAGTVLEQTRWIHPHGTPDDPKPWLEIPPDGGWAEISTGLRVKLPDNTWGNIKGRSSTAWKKRLLVIEGVIDASYVGPLFALVQNNTSRPIRVHEGDRLAQLIVVPKCEIPVIKTTKLVDTIRGSSGFGSSGI